MYASPLLLFEVRVTCSQSQGLSSSATIANPSHIHGQVKAFGYDLKQKPQILAVQMFFLQVKMNRTYRLSCDLFVSEQFRLIGCGLNASSVGGKLVNY